MAFIKADKSKAKSFTPIPEGNYECFIESGASKTASTGTPQIDFKLKVRDDIEGQEFGGRILWGRLFFNENTEGIVNGFLQAVDVPDGKEFETAQDLINFVTGKAILAKVKIETYKGEDRNVVGYMNASKVGGGKIEDPFSSPQQGTRAEEDPFARDSDAPIEISDDDLPF